MRLNRFKSPKKQDMAASTLEFSTFELSAVTVGFMGLAFSFGPLMVAEFQNLSPHVHDFGIFPAIVLRLGFFEA